MCDGPPASFDKAFAAMALSAAQHHVFLCVGPDCCSTEMGLEVWEYLKRRTKEMKLAALRTKASCFRICAGGPWMLVYPEGIWYGALTPQRCERILAEHLGQGRPVQEWIVQRHPLPQPQPGASA